jgi:RHS repeat-associated protein
VIVKDFPSISFFCTVILNDLFAVTYKICLKILRNSSAMSVILWTCNPAAGFVANTVYVDRLSARNADAFGYNARSEVVSATVASNEYAYDHIGNHTTASVNSDTTTYTANALNQYSQISVPSVPSVDNLIYDLDGNLLTNGVWSYTWDCENRLVSVSSNNVCVVSNAYDHMSRRVVKWTPCHTTTFVYDGWNLVQETVQTAQSTVTNRFVWGRDLSGTLQGAGGVGGLLAVSLNGAWCFPLFDANGNITAYVGESGSIVAEYVYDAYGGTIAASGSTSDTFRHRFSTKYFDTETGLYYYGYRFYDPAMHRWLNRDPIEEEGGFNLYAFCKNDGVNAVDVLGLWKKPKRDAAKNWAKIVAQEGDTFQSLATMLRLNFDERTKWLKFKGVFVSKRMDAKVGCTYEVPNTMVVYTSKSGFGDGVLTFVTHLKRRAEADGDRYSRKGYHVVRKLWQSSEDVFVNLWNEPGIAAISFAGHGARHGFIADRGSGMSVKPAEVSPPYKLQAVRAYSCRSHSEFTPDYIPYGRKEVATAWRQHVSNNGTYIGYTGLVNWVSQFWQLEAFAPDDIPD